LGSVRSGESGSSGRLVGDKPVGLPGAVMLARRRAAPLEDNPANAICAHAASWSPCIQRNSARGGTRWMRLKGATSSRGSSGMR
jgi:hypothetical protein